MRARRCGIEQLEQFFQRAAFRLAFDGRRGDGDDAFIDRGEADIFLVDEQQAALRLQDDLATVRARDFACCCSISGSAHRA